MLIDYKNVEICQGDKPILNDVCFHADDSEFIYIIGKVGSGKTSLLKSFYCELDIDADQAETAEVLGRDLKEIRRKEVPALRREMGIIFQDFQLLHDRTVWGNLQFVLRATGWKDKADIDKRIDEGLEVVGMKDKALVLPHELSGGEQQRVAIARAMLNKPKLIVADEPTGNLDPETASKITSLLKEITHTGAAVIMSTHNIAMIRQYPGIVYECADGKLREVTERFNSFDDTDDEGEETEEEDN